MGMDSNSILRSLTFSYTNETNGRDIVRVIRKIVREVKYQATRGLPMCHLCGKPSYLVINIVTSISTQMTVIV